MTILKAERLSVSFGEQRVLDGVDFAISPGEVVGLIGPNGAGKTTLLRALAGLASPTSGRLLLDGKQLSDVPRQTRGRVLGYLPQGGESHWALTVENLVALGRLAHGGPWQSAGPDDLAAIEAAMAACDVIQFRDRPINTLSGGERGRVLLARVVAGTPKILLADEPIAGLDPAHQFDAMTLLRRQADDGVGVAVVTHDLTHAARFCDRLALLFDGRIAVEGAPDDVLTPDTIAQCYGVRAHFGAVHGQNFVVPLDRDIT